MYSHLVACTGWEWDYIAENVDLPRLKALNHHWADNPPIHRMVAAFFGIEPTTAAEKTQSIEQAAEFIPVETLSEADFDALLRQHGLPTGE
ncbi:hypothetical protein Dsui_0203 [Azospira oryzae PS]|uniref:Uncharacterized protein n=2 Tax=Azospira oryzae TaxID=146939 RepID=G8QMP3_AZOOP|nr:hypothetical protein Dsui_0203 [Azospira oryzae PS]